MGHRHISNRSQMFEGEQDQSWNPMHMEQPHTNLVGGVGLPENGSFFYPVENISVDGVHFPSHWNPTPTPNGYISSNNNEALHCQPGSSDPPHDHFLRLSTAGTYCTVPENYASSSGYDRQTFHGIDGSFVDMTMGSGRGPHKRKSPGISSTCDRGSTSAPYAAGSSSNVPLSPEFWLEKTYPDPHYVPWEHMTMIPNYQANMSHRAESSTRNVRSRPALDLESNLVRAHLSSNCPRSSYPTSHNHSHPDFPGQSSSALTHELNHTRMAPAHARIPVSDPSGSSQERNPFPVGICGTSASVETRGYHHNLISCRNPMIPQSFHGDSSRPVRGARSTYSQRSGSSFRASSSSLGHAASSEESLQLVAESHFSRHPRLFERYRTLSNDGNPHDRLPLEGHMIADRSAFYGSRSMSDPHRDMRLDVDNMTYEELLALEERIGSVSTGLSEDLISKSLAKTVHRSSHKIQDKGNCAICLEDYEDMDDVGALRICGHDYHVNCIKKWLSMKNACPICKAAAVPDDMR